jgi:dienelactone hydrolase
MILLIAATLPAASQEKKDVDIAAADGVKLRATYFAAAKPGPGVLMLHMCNSSRAAWATLAPQLAAAGIHVLTLDYRGYGESGGGPYTSPQDQQRAMNEKWPTDIDAAYAFLIAQKGVDKNRTGAAGASCGVNQSIQLARRHAEVKSLVLLAGNTNSAGREFLRRANALPLFGSAADDDGDAVMLMRWTFGFSRSPQKEFVQYANGGHGTDLFPVQKDLQPKILAWFQKTLLESPIAAQSAPVSNANMPKPTPVEEFWDAVAKPGGATRARQMYDDAKQRDPKTVLFPEAEMNALGYEKLQEGLNKKAIELLSLNVEAYPDSPNVYDSLADAYLADGQREQALKYTDMVVEKLKTARNVTPQFRDLLMQSVNQKLKQLRPEGAPASGSPATPPAAATPPRQPAPMPPIAEVFPKPIVLAVPGMEKIQPRKDIVYKSVDSASGKLDLRLDAYIPTGAKPGERFPAVILISGGGADPQMDWRNAGVYQSYGKLLAASGFVGIPFTKRYTRGYDGVAQGESDTLDLVRYVRAHNAELHVDPDRIGVWVFSGGGLMMAPFLRERPVYVRALVAFYAMLGAPNDPNMTEEVRMKMARYSSLAHVPINVGGCCAAPVFVARAGLDNPGLNEALDNFVKEAKKEEHYITVELMEHPDGRHGFDIIDDNNRSREIIRGAIEFLKKNLGVK